jgi:DNA-binding transcriptional ArsR family regulator
MPDELRIEDEYIIDDPETLKILGDPLRIQILSQVARINEAGQLATAKALAEAIAVPQTKLYYHLNLLEDHDLLRVAETGLVSGIVEKRYQIRARRLRADVNIEPTFPTDGSEQIESVMGPLSSILDTTRQNLKRSVEAELDRLKTGQSPDMDQIHIQHKVLHLTDEQASQFVHKLEAIIGEYKNAADKTNRPYLLTTVFHPGANTQSNTQES